MHMKLLFFCLSLFVGSAHFFGDFYQFTFKTLDGDTVSTSSYQGKKVVIAVVGANAYGRAVVRFLDSVQTAHPNNLQVIAVPTGDFGSSTAAQDLSTLKQNTSIVITRPIGVKQSLDSVRHPLFRWLTQASENGHFSIDMDAEEEGHMFVISEEGKLVAVCSRPTRKAVFLALVGSSNNE
jgi:glutathione peroxidase